MGMGLKSRASDSNHGRWTECVDQLGRRAGGWGAGNSNMHEAG